MPGSQVLAKVFFNCQYFIIIVISDFDFWLVNGHE